MRARAGGISWWLLVGIWRAPPRSGLGQQPKQGPQTCLVVIGADQGRDLAKEGPAHSEYKRVIELSNPSLPDYGIDEQWLWRKA